MPLDLASIQSTLSGFLGGGGGSSLISSLKGGLTGGTAKAGGSRLYQDPTTGRYYKLVSINAKVMRRHRRPYVRRQSASEKAMIAQMTQQNQMLMMLALRKD